MKKVLNFQDKQVFYKHLNIQEWKFCRNFIFGTKPNEKESVWVHKDNDKKYVVVRWDGDWSNKYIVKDYEMEENNKND